MHTCPVCAYDKLEVPPKDYYICPQCGVEFENDDYDRTHEQLRAGWIAAGRPFWRDMARDNPAWQSWYHNKLHPEVFE